MVFVSHVKYLVWYSAAGASMDFVPLRLTLFTLAFVWRSCFFAGWPLDLPLLRFFFFFCSCFVGPSSWCRTGEFPPEHPVLYIVSNILIAALLQLNLRVIAFHPPTLHIHETFVQFFVEMLATFPQIIAPGILHIKCTLHHMWNEHTPLCFRTLLLLIHLGRCVVENWRNFFASSPFYTCPDLLGRDQTRSDMFRHVWSCSDMIVWLIYGDAENARLENAGLEISAPNCRGGKCRTGKFGNRKHMERHVRHNLVFL